MLKTKVFKRNYIHVRDVSSVFIHAINNFEKMRGQISRDFPEYNTYLEFKAPYFKIQVGDFINKLNAFMLLKEISKSYRGAYIVPTTVYFEEINSEE